VSSAYTMSSRAGRWAHAVLVALALAVASGRARADVTVRAQLQRSTITLGESATLEVTVSGALSGIQQPEIGLPQGLEILGSGREESMQFVNGRVDHQVVFRFELGASRAGRFTVGPIRVRVGGTDYVSGAVALTVVSTMPRAAPGGRDVVWLSSQATPSRVWVGQEVMLTVKLLQRTGLAQDPEYNPPATPGFWTDRPSPPESYYADAGGQRVLVTETRTRLYPLADGALTIGPAQALVVIPVQNPRDPFGFLGGGSGRQVALLSDSQHVQVYPLPRPEPDGFGGAVGTFAAHWGSDRRRTALDTPFTIVLDLRGVGNLPLVRAPDWHPEGCEIYARQVEDSLGRPGTEEPGRKRVQWTVLARHAGTLQITPPALAWFDPSTAHYQTADLPPLTLEVTPPSAAGNTTVERYPEFLLAHPAAPGGSGPTPWAWGLAGILLGVSLRVLDRAGAKDESGPERARAAGWARALESPARSPDWWRTADDAVAWLAERGALVHHLRQQIHAARYGGVTSAETEVRLKTLEHLRATAPAPPARWTLRFYGFFIALAGIFLAVLMGPRLEDARLSALAQQAESWARRGDWDRARQRWEEVWQASDGDPGVAARLGWAALQSGEIGPATLWVLRGWMRDPRDASVRWVAQRARESGALLGESGSGWWPSALEAALVAALAGAGLAWYWGREWRLASLLGVLGAAAMAVLPVRVLAQRGTERVVVMRETELVPSSGDRLAMEPGQVLRVRSRAGNTVRVSAGPGVEGLVAAADVTGIEAETPTH